MKTLILMRHAKSDWSTGATSDHARPLNPRGIASAAVLGNWLRARGWLPDQILCSSATRTRETLSGLALDAPVRFLDTLYHAEAEAMLDIVRSATGDTVLMVAHNPGISDFAHLLVADPPEHPRFDDYPTGATLVVQFAVEKWDDVQFETGQVADFMVPRELSD